MPTALITGSTSGIGAAFARELARKGHDLILVARTRDELDAQAAALAAEHGIHVEVIVADLADRAQLERVAQRLRAPAGDVDERGGTHIGVDLLVNNAGFGMKESFLDDDLDTEERAVDVMIRAVLVLAHAAGQTMRARGRGAVINVSSVAGFLASGTYSAAKAWVTTFSEGLALELAPHGVVVTALCPGFTRTEFHRRAKMSPPELPGPLWLDADKLVADCLADVRRRRVVSIPGTSYKVISAVLDVLPRGVVRAATQRLAPGGH